jgi:hypothetical protein
MGRRRQRCRSDETEAQRWSAERDLRSSSAPCYRKINRNMSANQNNQSLRSADRVLKGGKKNRASGNRNPDRQKARGANANTKGCENAHACKQKCGRRRRCQCHRSGDGHSTDNHFAGAPSPESEGAKATYLLHHPALRNANVIPRRVLHQIHHLIGLPDNIVRRPRVMRIRRQPHRGPHI